MTELHLDLPPIRPLRVAIEQALREAIHTGRITTGSAVPSTRELAAALGVSRGTVVHAYDQLIAEGWLTARQGAPTIVARGQVAESAVSPAPPPPRPRWDLRPGHPDTSLFPARAWTSAQRAVLDRGEPDAHEYPDRLGQRDLRVALAEHLARSRRVLCPPERIVVCPGFGSALVTLATMFRALGHRAIGMEDPCFHLHRQLLERVGLRVRPVPVDDHGVDPAGLVGVPVRALVVTPAHQNPLGATLTPGRRRQLVEWARRVDGYLVEDDYDGEYRFDRRPVGALHALDPSRVIYAGTASKTLSPGLRLAWLAVPARLMDALAAAVPLGTVPSLDQLTLAEILRDGRFARHVRRGHAEYQRRHRRLVRLLATVPGARLTGIAAGLHAVLRLAGGPARERELLAAAAERSLALSGLEPYWHGLPRAGGLVIGYSRPPVADADAAIDQLVDLLHSTR
ncbi:GntR family transcriptional regulator / MocR family aminotransferase [Streptoalloteichus tenebrarius]|uniref:GntR family transcriptional regulator / MocR family aminotransferase n=1 Tax=Streptoalloteichus tenebrarius (strain ATCC 17920 / DSM 40477 / JCM 4838 / CBS 697.72 / NBRC 16177 / NCIMB 11028 / NRRL B-12390 / A12253. 1 / ISP 5477) TaxID=1933 RepID=A0ABT1HU37_STRSD|nr:PLP-dependent aminotransferase family protein [Streptoalloteichus tenebrarius]MCP2259024.1 GntR family transcriptional regulator / MocR family aminotransferase [Streptoalloteichus tenebrarius]BFE99651.1 PLP-dependent aminotransferase family protein [Streptoalloteichus tenebrarius]